MVFIGVRFPDRIQNNLKTKEVMKNNILTSTNYKFAGLHFCANHSGKMSGIQSLSTDPRMNKHCIKRTKIKDSICSKCFSFRRIKLQKLNFPDTLEDNTNKLRTIINAELFPTIIVRYFRFESFGDLYCNEQVHNYFNLCEKNPKTYFALWTKNPQYIANVLNEGRTKPNNLNIILSSPIINQPMVGSRFPFVDKIFTVYDKSYANEHKIDINCGARSCITCGKCYEKNEIRIVNELLK